MSLPNPSMDFTPFDILTAAEMDDLVENDQALAAGTGLNNNAVTVSKLADDAVTVPKMDFSTFPAFKAYLTAAQAVTTAGGTVALASTTELYDTTGSFVPATNVFTAPITGIYLFTYHVADNSGNVTRMTPIITKNGVTNYTGLQQNQSFACGVLVLELSLTAGDTMQAKINANPNNGTLIAGDGNSWWTGRLVG